MKSRTRPSPVLLQHVGVRHHRRAGQDGLRRPEVLAEAPWPLHRVHQLAARFRAPLDLEPEHRAVHAVGVLLVGERFLRKAGQSRVPYGVDLCLGQQQKQKQKISGRRRGGIIRTIV